MITNIRDYEEEFLDQIRMAAQRKLPLESLKLEGQLSPQLMAQAQDDYDRASRHAGQNILRDVGQMGAAAAAAIPKALEIAAKGPSKAIAEGVWGKVGEYLQDPEDIASDLQNVANQSVVSSRLVRDPVNYMEEHPIETLSAAADIAGMPMGAASKFSKIKKPKNIGKIKEIGELGESLAEIERREKYEGGRTKEGLKYDQEIEPTETINKMSPDDEFPTVDPESLPGGKKWNKRFEKGQDEVTPNRDRGYPLKKTFVEPDVNVPYRDDSMDLSDKRKARIPDMSKRPVAERIRDLERAKDSDWYKNPKNKDALDQAIRDLEEKDGSWSDEEFGMSEEITGPYAKIRKPKNPPWDTMDSGEMDIGEMPNYPDTETIDVENLSPADAEMMSFVEAMAKERASAQPRVGMFASADEPPGKPSGPEKPTKKNDLPDPVGKDPKPKTTVGTPSWLDRLITAVIGPKIPELPPIEPKPAIKIRPGVAQLDLPVQGTNPVEPDVVEKAVEILSKDLGLEAGPAPAPITPPKFVDPRAAVDEAAAVLRGSLGGAYVDADIRQAAKDVANYLRIRSARGHKMPGPQDLQQMIRDRATSIKMAREIEIDDWASDGGELFDPEAEETLPQKKKIEDRPRRKVSVRLQGEFDEDLLEKVGKMIDEEQAAKDAEAPIKSHLKFARTLAEEQRYPEIEGRDVAALDRLGLSPVLAGEQTSPQFSEGAFGRVYTVTDKDKKKLRIAKVQEIKHTEQEAVIRKALAAAEQADPSLVGLSAKVDSIKYDRPNDRGVILMERLFELNDREKAEVRKRVPTSVRDMETRYRLKPTATKEEVLKKLNVEADTPMVRAFKEKLVTAWKDHGIAWADLSLKNILVRRNPITGGSELVVSDVGNFRAPGLKPVEWDFGDL